MQTLVHVYLVKSKITLIVTLVIKLGSMQLNYDTAKINITNCEITEWRNVYEH